MRFSSHIFTITATAILIGTCKGSPIGTIQQDDLIWLGSINDKAFFTVTNETTMSWFGARDVCAYHGLELASFQDSEEFNLVRSNVDYDTKLWISGSIEGQNSYTSLSAFRWLDGSGISGINFHHWANHWICLIFSGDDHMYTELCTGGLYKPLCQTVPSTLATETVATLKYE